MRVERLTTKSREALAQAQSEATRRGNPELTPDHVLAALMRQDDTIVPAVLAKLGLAPLMVRNKADEAVGKLPKAAMGHNWVLSKASDAQGVAADGIPAGLDKAYVKPGDARVIAHTKVIGGGETDSVSFDVSKLKAGDSYAWFCSFPGHASIMKGTLTLSK